VERRADSDSASLAASVLTQLSRTGREMIHDVKVPPHFRAPPTRGGHERGTPHHLPAPALSRSQTHPKRRKSARPHSIFWASRLADEDRSAGLRVICKRPR
jgi:hypothetical protein